MSGFPRAILFDCDGTLFDTERLKARSWGTALVQLLKREGDSTPTGMGDEVAAMYEAGGTTEEVAADILRKSQARFSSVSKWPTPGKLITERDIVKKTIVDEMYPLEPSGTNQAKALVIKPVWDFVLEAKRNGRIVSLVTTTQLHWVTRYFAGSDLSDQNNKPITRAEEVFDPVVCGKKKGDGVREALRQILGKTAPAAVTAREASDFLIVEDSPEGSREAKSVGIRVLTVPNSFTQASFPDLLLSQRAIGRLLFGEVIGLLTRAEKAGEH